MVARRAHNPKAVGSSPTPATQRESGNWFSFFVFTPMFTTYVIYSDLANKIYIGFSSDIQNRLLAGYFGLSCPILESENGHFILIFSDIPADVAPTEDGHTRISEYIDPLVGDTDFGLC